MSTSNGEQSELNRNISKLDGTKPEKSPLPADDSNATNPNLLAQEIEKLDLSSPISDAESWGDISPSEERPELPTLRSDGSMVIVGSDQASPAEKSSGSDSKSAESPKEPLSTSQKHSATANLSSTSTSKVDSRDLPIADLEEKILESIDETTQGPFATDELENALVEKVNSAVGGNEHALLEESSSGASDTIRSSCKNLPPQKQPIDLHGTESLRSMDKESLPNTMDNQSLEASGPESTVECGLFSFTKSDSKPSSSVRHQEQLLRKTITLFVPTRCQRALVTPSRPAGYVSPSLQRANKPTSLDLSGIPKFSNPPPIPELSETEKDFAFTGLPGHYGEKCCYPGCGENINVEDRIWFLDCECSVVHRQCWARKVMFGCPWCERKVKSWTMSPTVGSGQDDSISEI
ncbi:hypothetical protein BZA77DRAFT_349126 [Pyronema omphalodes]|nr:hypothetical protein BZA77DRAFT_349126 [Pyronema omphalodes]